MPRWVATWLLRDETPDRGEKGRREWARAYLGTGSGPSSFWRRFEGQLLAEWVKDYPGTRPRSWWERMAPEVRKVRPSGRFFVREDQPRGDGLPLVYSHETGWLYYGRMQVESEAAYLRRLGLFLPGEAKRIRGSAYRLQTVDTSSY